MLGHDSLVTLVLRKCDVIVLMQNLAAQGIYYSLIYIFYLPLEAIITLILFIGPISIPLLHV